MRQEVGQRTGQCFVLVVRKDSAVRRLADLNGATGAFPAPNAFAASLLPRALLASLSVFSGMVIAGAAYHQSRRLIEQTQERARDALARGLVVALSDQLVVAPGAAARHGL